MRSSLLAAAAALVAAAWLGRTLAAVPALRSEPLAAPASMGHALAGGGAESEAPSAGCCWIYYAGQWWCVPC